MALFQNIIVVTWAAYDKREFKIRIQLNVTSSRLRRVRTYLRKINRLSAA